MPEKSKKNAETYECQLCSFVCGKRSNYYNHLSTRKHARKQNGNMVETDFIEKNAVLPGATKNAASLPGYPPTSVKANACKTCGKSYKCRSGLWKHRKHCFLEIMPYTDSLALLDTPGGELLPHAEPHFQEPATNADVIRLIMDLVKENQEIKELLMKQNEKLAEYRPVIIQQQITNNTHISLNVFLQEKCKDAINMSEFVENLNIEMGDLETVGRVGYVEGISRIIVNELNRLDIYTRPIHCTDKKRETIYIKDHDEWMRDTETKEYTKRVIERISNKNLNKIPEWRRQHPAAEIMDTKECEMNMNIMIHSLGGLGGTTADKTAKNQEKIIKMLANSVFIDKMALETAT